MHNLDFIVEKHHLNDTGLTRHYLTLYSIVLGMESKNVFEFGAGFSTQAMVEALKVTGGKLTSVDQRPLSIREDIPDSFVRDNKNIWSFYEGNSLDVVPTLDHSECYDVVLHDGSHTGIEVTEDLNNIAPYVKRGGLVLIHDTAHYDLGPEMRAGLANSNLIKKYKHDGSTLPYGYGLTIVKIFDNPNNDKSVEILWKKE
jgi:predicted O-methyltransferase YrrM